MELYRYLLFLIGCIGARSLFTAGAAWASSASLRIMGYLALIPVIGWFYIIFIGERERGAEVFGEKIWWKSLRPVHMILWATFAYLAINGYRYAWTVLLADTIIGLVAFLSYRGLHKRNLIST